MSYNICNYDFLEFVSFIKDNAVLIFQYCDIIPKLIKCLTCLTNAVYLQSNKVFWYNSDP